MRMVSERQLVGRRIIKFSPCPFSDGRGGTAHDPVITLDDGSRLTFIVEETDTGEYGVFVSLHKPKKPTP